MHQRFIKLCSYYERAKTFAAFALLVSYMLNFFVMPRSMPYKNLQLIDIAWLCPIQLPLMQHHNTVCLKPIFQMSKV